MTRIGAILLLLTIVPMMMVSFALLLTARVRSGWRRTVCLLLFSCLVLMSARRVVSAVSTWQRLEWVGALNGIVIPVAITTTIVVASAVLSYHWGVRHAGRFR